MGMFDGGPLELASMAIYTDVLPGDPLIVRANRNGILFIEAAALVEGDATLTVQVDGEPVAQSFVRLPGVGPIYAAHLLDGVPADVDHRVSLHIDGVWFGGSPRLRVSADLHADADRLRPGGPL